MTFLQPKSEACLFCEVHDRPIIVLNVSKIHRDAILLIKSEITSISLSYLMYYSMIIYCTTPNHDNQAQRESLEEL